MDFCFHSPAPESTHRLGEALAPAILGATGAAASGALVIGLIGALGAGKTLFVRGLAAGLGVDEAQVASPTFGLIHEYAGGRMPLAHVDLYRIDSERELENSGFLDLLGSGALVAVEWADRLPGALPSDRLEFEFRFARTAEPGHREGRATAKGPNSARVLERWRAALPESSVPEKRIS